AIPPALESIILHCLEKAPEDRFQSAQDVGYALEAGAGQTGPMPLTASSASPLRRHGSWIAALVLTSCLSMLLGYVFLGAHRPHPSVDGRIFAQITNDAGAELFPSISADGKTVVYASKSSGNWDIYLQQVGFAEAVN